MKRSAQIVSKVSDISLVDPGGMRNLAQGLNWFLEEQERLRAWDHRDTLFTPEREMIRRVLASGGCPPIVANILVHFSSNNIFAAFTGRSPSGDGFDNPAVLEVDLDVNMDIDLSSHHMSLDDEAIPRSFPFTYPAVGSSSGMILVTRPLAPPAEPSESFAMEVTSPPQSPPSVDVLMMSPFSANRQLGPICRRHVDESGTHGLIYILGKHGFEADVGPPASFKSHLPVDFYGRPVFVLRRGDEKLGQNIMRLGVDYSEWVDGHELPRPPLAVIEPVVVPEEDSGRQVQLWALPGPRRLTTHVPWVPPLSPGLEETPPQKSSTHPHHFVLAGWTQSTPKQAMLQLPPPMRSTL